MRWKDFLYFQRNSKTAVILLLILILLTLILNVVVSYRYSSDVILVQNDSLVREFDQFKKSLNMRDLPSTAAQEANKAGDGTSRSVKRQTGESVTGELNRQNNSQDDTQNEKNAYPNKESPSQYSSDLYPRTIYPTIKKLSEGETIALNEADTAEWKKIPGIGSAYASRIVKYRDLLGGFVKTEQLLEVYGIDQELYSRINGYIKPDNNYRKVKINHLEFKDLLRHPYLNYKQVQAVMSIRRRKGDISSIRELSILDEFTPEDIFRIEPYLDFSE